MVPTIPSAAPNNTSPVPLSPEREAEIRTRELVATRGPWGLYDSDDGFVDIAADLKENSTGYNCRRSITQLEADLIDNDPAHAEWSADEEREQVLIDAEFIAASREDIPALLAEVDRLRAELAARPSRAEVLRQEGDAIVKHCPDHGPQDQDGVWMDCHCDVADEMRRRADEAATGGAS